MLGLMQVPVLARRLFYRGWKRLPQRGRALAVRLIIPRSPLGAAVLLRDGEGRVLLVRPSYYRRSRWTLPGGWAKRGEEPAETARREAREEVGADVVVRRPLAAGRGVFGEVTVVFEADWAGGQQELVLDAEIAEAAFFAPDALPPLFGPARRLIDDALRFGERGG
jgi:ADP-ribose pyrophosphatase YjhB (NUDIX family)